MTERFARYIQIYEPFTLKDASNNSITFEPNGTQLDDIIDNVRTKVVTLNAYDFESFTTELKSVFDVSFEVKDDLLLTKKILFIHLLLIMVLIFPNMMLAMFKLCLIIFTIIATILPL